MDIKYQIVIIVIFFIILATVQHTLNAILIQLKDIKNILSGIRKRDTD